jgi:hypothetical protein
LARLQIFHAAENARPAAQTLRAAAAGAAVRRVIVVVVDAFRVDQFFHEGNAPEIIRGDVSEKTQKAHKGREGQRRRNVSTLETQTQKKTKNKTTSI